MDKHTKGPYTVSPLPNRRVYQPGDLEVVDPHQQVIATLYAKNRSGNGEDEANARLLAASWEMHKLLHKLVYVIDAAHAGRLIPDARALLAEIDGK